MILSPLNFKSFLPRSETCLILAFYADSKNVANLSKKILWYVKIFCSVCVFCHPKARLLFFNHQKHWRLLNMFPKWPYSKHCLSQNATFQLTRHKNQNYKSGQKGIKTFRLKNPSTLAFTTYFLTIIFLLWGRSCSRSLGERLK